MRWRTKIGLPCQTTVMPWPSAIGVRSTSTDDSASTSFDGFIESISGQAMAPAPIDRAGTGDELQEIALGHVAGT